MYPGPWFGQRWFGNRWFWPYGCDENTEHRASRFLVATASLQDFTHPVYDSGWTHLDLEVPEEALESHTVPDGTLVNGVGYCSRTGYRTRDCCEVWSEPCCWIQSGVPVVCIGYPPLKRVEIWTDLQCAGGVKLWDLSRWSQANAFYGATTKEEVAGREEFHLDLQRDSDAWDHIRARRVVRTVFGRLPDNSDELWREWRIQDEADGREPEDAVWGRVLGVGVKYDLGDRTLAWRQANGKVLLSWSLFNLTITDHLAFILARAAEHGIDWLEIGTIEDNPTARYDLDYENASPLGLLGRLAELAELELDIPPIMDEDLVGTGYAVHMLRQIGETCDRPEIRYRKNLLALKRETKTEDFSPRVYPVGGEQDGTRLTIANAQWTIVSVDVAQRRVYLADAPILYDDQLNGLYAEVAGSSLRHLVEDTDQADQFVVLVSVAGIAASQALTFREDQAGTDLAWLQNPASFAAYGRVAPPQDPVEIPFIDNLAPNAFLSVVDGIDDPTPQDWFAIGPTPATLAINTDQQFFQYGSSSLHVEAPAAGDGVESGWVPIFPTERSPYIAVQVALWVVSGTVQLELILDTGDVEITFPDPGGAPATTSKVGLFNHELGLRGIDAFQAGGQFAKVRVKASGGAAEFYVDAVALTQTPGGVDGYFEGLASNLLWHEGNRILALRSEPHVSYDVPLADMTRLDGTRWPFDEIAKGAHALVYDDDPLGVDAVLRITAIERNELNEGESRVTLARTPDALTRFLQRERTGTRRAVSRVGSGGRTDGGSGDNPSQGAISGFGGSLSPTALNLAWFHNNVVQTNAGNIYTIDLREEAYQGGSLVRSRQLVTDRDPRLEFDVGDTSAADKANGRGSVLWTFADITGGPTTYIWYASLKKSGAVTQTQTASITGPYDLIP